MVRMKDVAARAGVSIATVSNVITGKQNVSQEVRDAVLAAIEELDYNINLVARGLKTQRTNTIGVIMPDVTKLFFLDVIKGIVEESNRLGYKINMMSSNYDFETERSLVAWLRSSRVDGILLDSCVGLADSAKWADELAGDAMPPVVSIENRLDPDRISAIVVDSQYWSGRLTQHLIDLGRKNIFFLAGPLGIEHEQNRLNGYRNVMKANGLPLSEDYLFSGDFSSGVAHDAVVDALARGLQFDAVQASNDQAAIGAIKALLENGIAVPEQVAVCGFDNLFPSTLVTPAITTIDVPRYEMGVSAVREAVRRIDAPDTAPTHYILSAGMVVRASTQPNIITEWSLENW